MSIEASVRRYLMCCPFCGSAKMQIYAVIGARDALTCLNCGAKWHIYLGWDNALKWAELDIPSRNGKGAELLGKRFKAEWWQKMVLEAQKTLEEASTQHTERKTVVVKEREIVKVRCRYCNGLYEESLNKCPHCGAKS